MPQKIIGMYGLKTSNYRFSHTVKIPSEMMDYDYAYGKRYPSTYVHKLEVIDAITEMKVVTIEFSSDVCAEMICNLYRVWTTNCEILSENECPIKLLGNSVKDYMVSFWKMSNKNNGRTKDSFIDVFIREDGCTEPIIILHLWSSDEIQAFINLLDVPAVQDMFVLPSTDRD